MGQRPIRCDLPARYGPLLEFLRELPGFHHDTDAELTRQAIFFVYYYLTQENTEGLTQHKVICQHWHKDEAAAIGVLRFKEAYDQFEKNSGIITETLFDAQPGA